MPKVGTVTTPKTFEPYWQTTDGEAVKLYQGDVLSTLKRLPTGSVQCVITSPPYWGLRDYGTGTWTGGNPECDHRGMFPRDDSGGPGKQYTNVGSNRVYSGDCRCGATRIDHQLGSERIPDCLGWAKGENCAEKDWASGCHVCRMVLVFREVRRVLRDDGVLWLNYGDSYSGGKMGRADDGSGDPTSRLGPKRDGLPSNSGMGPIRQRPPCKGIPSGNLCGIPWRVALALQADGWVLRQDVVWQKPSPMPESVQNRCTKAHEYVFLLVKKMGYYCDMEAIKEEHTSSGVRRATSNEHLADRTAAGSAYAQSTTDKNGFGRDIEYHGRNKRSVWSIDDNRALLDYLTLHSPELLKQFLAESGYKGDVWRVASAGYPGAHYATFPPKLIEPMILAGTSAKGACICGAPWKRVTADLSDTRTRVRTGIGQDEPDGRVGRAGEVNRETLRWEPTCTCHGEFVKRKGTRLGYGSYHDHKGDGTEYGLRQKSGGLKALDGRPSETDSLKNIKEFETTIIEYIPSIPLEDHPIRPCVILDPFMGSGTSAIVALDHGRRCWGIDLSKKYLDENALPRIKAWFRSRPDLRHMVERVIQSKVLGRLVSSEKGKKP